MKDAVAGGGFGLLVCLPYLLIIIALLQTAK